MTDDSPKPTNKIDSSVPHSARIWNFWLGGKDHYPVDRATGEEMIRLHPHIVTAARHAQYYRARAVRLLATRGIHQFLDIGCGLPATDTNTHEIARRVNPHSRTLYIDNDPLVTVTGDALLAEGRTHHLRADLRQPRTITTQARKHLKASRPLALLLLNVLGHLDDHTARTAVHHLMARTAPGSHLIHCDLPPTGPAQAAFDVYNDTGATPYRLRTPDELTAFYHGLDLLDPGIGPVTHWHPDIPWDPPPAPTNLIGGVARKP